MKRKAKDAGPKKLKPEGAAKVRSAGQEGGWMLVRQRGLLLICLLLVCGSAWVALRTYTLRYEATARLKVVGGEDGTVGCATQYELLRSAQVWQRSTEKLSRENVPIKHGTERQWWQRGPVRVERVGDSRLIDVVGVAEDAAAAAAIANAVVTAYEQTAGELRQVETARALDGWQQRIVASDGEITELAEAVRAYREKHLMMGEEISLSAIEERMAAVEWELTQAELAAVAWRGKQETLENVTTDGRAFCDGEVLIPEIDEHPAVQATLARIEQLKDDEAKLAAVYESGHGRLRELGRVRAEMQTGLQDEKRRLVQVFLREAVNQQELAERERERLRELRDEVKRQGVDLLARWVEYEELVGAWAQARQFRSECRSQVRQLQMNERVNEVPIAVLARAEAPTRAANLSRAQQTGAILILGTLASLGLACVVDRRALRWAARMAPPVMYVPLSRRGEARDTVAAGAGETVKLDEGGTDAPETVHGEAVEGAATTVLR